MLESPSETLARQMPKVLLHEHLDGGLRVSTLLELLAERGLDSPAPDVPGLTRWFDEHAFAHSLEQYLKGFDLTVAAMATPAALRRVAFEAAEDARADGAVLAEFRIAPLLFEAHGVPAEAAVDAMLAGLAQSPLPSGLILCGMRHQFGGEVERTAELAIRYLGRGVVGFDLAGPEAGFPPSRHAATLARVRAAGVPITLHAGEADVAERVIEAADHGAVRIGHGVHLSQALADPARRHLVEEARARPAPRGVPHQQRAHRRLPVAGGAPHHGAVARRRGMLLQHRQPPDVDGGPRTGSRQPGARMRPHDGRPAAHDAGRGRALLPAGGSAGAGARADPRLGARLRSRPGLKPRRQSLAHDRGGAYDYFAVLVTYTPAQLAPEMGSSMLAAIASQPFRRPSRSSPTVVIAASAGAAGSISVAPEVVSITVR